MKYLILIIIIITQITISIAQTKTESPNSEWPYLFNKFESGIIYYRDIPHKKLHINYSLLDNKFHLIDESNKINRLNTALKVDSITIINTTFIIRDKIVYEILTNYKGNLLLKKYKADLESLKSNSGAYGSSSSTAATTNLNSVYSSNTIGQTYDIVKLKAKNGKAFRVFDTNYFILNGKPLETATKRNLRNAFSKNSVKKFVKENNLKYNNENDVIQIFIYGCKNFMID